MQYFQEKIEKIDHKKVERGKKLLKITSYLK